MIFQSQKVSYLEVLAGDRHDSFWPWSIWDPTRFHVSDFDSVTHKSGRYLMVAL